MAKREYLKAIGDRWRLVCPNCGSTNLKTVGGGLNHGRGPKEEVLKCRQNCGEIPYAYDKKRGVEVRI